MGIYEKTDVAVGLSSPWLVPMAANGSLRCRKFVFVSYDSVTAQPLQTKCVLVIGWRTRTNSTMWSYSTRKRWCMLSARRRDAETCARAAFLRTRELWQWARDAQKQMKI
jgi:hypothetical protein